MASKRFKDPLYGYIEISNNLIDGIINTPVFQRLRRICQTSYSPLYPTAVHNRFIHSLGVFHLGSIAIKSLTPEIKKIDDLGLNNDQIDRLGEVFLIACLLHDVGHAPFSHTGEDLFKDKNNKSTALHTSLIACIQSEKFKENVPLEEGSSAKPHEILSAIIGIKEFDKFFSDADEKEFFARCITGYLYFDKDDKTGFIPVDQQLKNCYISLLNSNVIDVDRLDYLIRDAFITGFDTVKIDYERLLSSITVIDNGEKLELGFYKNALSVIENVVYAHDTERKWIQNHPTIVYESHILHLIMERINDKYKGKIFSEEAMSYTGCKEKKHLFRLLCDDDIICLIKDEPTNELYNEFFDRNKRRKPVWKSEAEFKAFMLGPDIPETDKNHMKKAFRSTIKYMELNGAKGIVDNDILKKINEDYDSLESMEELDQRSKRTQLNEKKDVRSILTCLNSFSKEKCDFVMLSLSQFKSGFSKTDFSKIKIVFKTKQGNQSALFGDIASSISGSSNANDSFFYIFYRCNDDVSSIDCKELCEKLYTAIKNK